MPRHLLFIQGAGAKEPEGSGGLIRHLEAHLGSEYLILAPDLPDADNPTYPAWSRAIDSELQDLPQDSLIVGHSFGGAVLLKLLAETPYPRRLAGLYLVSVPWCGRGGWQWDELALPDDFASRLPELGTVVAFHCRNDPEVQVTHIEFYHEAIPRLVVRILEGEEHAFRQGLPELVTEIQGL